MMLKLYAVPISLYCAKVRIVLRHKQLNWEEELPPGGYGSDEYKEIIPAGNLPALIHDNLMLGDSEAIAEYLNEEFPVPNMLPGSTKERAKIRERSRFHDTRLEPAVRALFPHINAGKRDIKIVSNQWEVLKERIGQFGILLPNDTKELTLGDCGAVVTLTWIDELTIKLDQTPIITEAMRSYHDQMVSHKAVLSELLEYQPRLTNWLSSQ